MKGRPTKAQQETIKRRNKLIYYVYIEQSFTKAEIARIFRLPRNTVSSILK